MTAWHDGDQGITRFQYSLVCETVDWGSTTPSYKLAFGESTLDKMGP
jgi:hypothetical protein